MNAWVSALTGIECACFTATSVECVLMLDGCDHIYGSKEKLIERLTRRGKEGWLIAPEPGAALYSGGFDLEPVAAATPCKEAEPGPFVLYHVKPRVLPPLSIGREGCLCV